MDRKIYEELIKLTDEEKRILKGEITVNKDIYTDDSRFVIDSNKFLSKGNLINIRKHTRFIEFPNHKHNYIEVNYVYEGSLTEIIDGKEIELKQGELVFLNPSMEHKIKKAGKEDICINFIIKPEFFDYIFSFFDNNNVITKFLISTLYAHGTMGECLYFKCSKDLYIQNILDKIITEVYSDNMMSSVTIKLLVGLLFVELIKNQDNIEIYCDDNYERKMVVDVLTYINESYRDASLATISKKLNQPDYKLSKLIKKHTNMTFKELLQDKKLSKACNLLKEKNISIVNILEIVGYENPTYFYKIFKEKYGVTPKVYKESIN